MHAIGYQAPGPITADASLVDIELPTPTPAGRDLLVEVRAVPVNPVDAKVRKSVAPDAGGWKVLGWDTVGRVAATGPDVTGFAVGDEVFYAGSLIRPGTNSEFHLVDERIVGRKPASLSAAAAAALPLTAITGWEMLFDRLDVRKPVPGAAPAILVMGGAGGVGSTAIQLARQLTDLTVIATASRPETRDWVIYGTPGMAEQGKLLTEVACLIDAGRLRTTLTECMSPINAANLKRAHALIESGKARGRVVLEGFGVPV